MARQLKAKSVDDNIEKIVEIARASPLAWVGSGHNDYLNRSATFDASGSCAVDGKQLVRCKWSIYDDDQSCVVTTKPFFVTWLNSDHAGQQVKVCIKGKAGYEALAVAPLDVTIDADAAPAEIDNCPDVHNLGQEGMDGDGVGNACDEGSFCCLPGRPKVAIIAPPLEGKVNEPISIEGNMTSSAGYADELTMSWLVSGGGCYIENPWSLETTVSCYHSGKHRIYLQAVIGGRPFLEEAEISIEK